MMYQEFPFQGYDSVVEEMHALVTSEVSVTTKLSDHTLVNELICCLCGETCVGVALYHLVK